MPLTFETIDAFVNYYYCENPVVRLMGIFTMAFVAHQLGAHRVTAALASDRVQPGLHGRA